LQVELLLHTGGSDTGGSDTQRAINDVTVLVVEMVKTCLMNWGEYEAMHTIP